MLKFPGYRFTVMFLFFGLLIASSDVLSQAARDSVTFSLETGSVISDGQTPFWLFSNNFNSVTKQPLNLWLRGKLSGESTAGKSFRFNYGMDVIDLYGGHNKTYFQ